MKKSVLFYTNERERQEIVLVAEGTGKRRPTSAERAAAYTRRQAIADELKQILIPSAP